MINSAFKINGAIDTADDGEKGWKKFEERTKS